MQFELVETNESPLGRLIDSQREVDLDAIAAIQRKNNRTGVIAAVWTFQGQTIWTDELHFCTSIRLCRSVSSIDENPFASRPLEGIRVPLANLRNIASDDSVA